MFLAEDDRLQRKVALKILASDRSGAERSEFANEVRAISALNHPRILTIYEVGSADGTEFMATEYVDGENLREMLERGSIPPRNAVEIAIAIAEALTAAHEAGVVHGDIKPENVMVRRDGHVKVLDFGVARLVRSSEKSTAPFEGTIHYVAPEIFLGAKPGERSDIFSFGVLLYELLGGEPPFDGVTAEETRTAILNNEPRRLRRLNRHVPASLEAVVDRALTKDPGARYQNASRMLIDLQRVRRELDAIELRRTGEDSAGWNRTRLAAISLVVALALVAAAGGVAWLMNRRHVNRSPEALAVLPFVSRPGDQRTEVLAEGLTESLISELSRFPNLRVTARSSVYTFARKIEDPRRIGRELGADVVLLGRLQRSGTALVIHAELVDVVDGERMWGETYRSEARDLVALEHQIARNIAEALRATLVPSSANRRTRDPDAHLLYLEGRFHWNKRTREGFDVAIERFNAAIDRDPGYAAAYAGLADVYNLLGTYLYMAPADAFPRARTAALRAIELDPNLAEAHTSLAYALQNYDWDWTAAEREYRAAIALSPSYAIAHHWYGGFLMLMGRFDEAIEQRTTAAKLDPLSPQIHAALGSPYLLSRRYPQAIDAYLKALALNPRAARVRLSLASAYLYNGNVKNALVEIDRARAVLGDAPDAKADLAYAYARAGRAAEAEAILRQLKRTARREYVDPYDFARIEIALGKHDEALGDLEMAYEMRSNLLMNLKVDPALDPVRETRRFKRLMERMKFPS